MGLVGASIAGALACVLVATGCTSSDPASTEPSAGQDLAGSVQAFLDERRGSGVDDLRTILVWAGDEIVLEAGPAGPAETADTLSVTKSVVSTLVGIAVDDGDLTLDQTLGESLPDHARVMSPETAAITVRQLLTMTAGFAFDFAPRQPLPSGPDPVAVILRKGPRLPPGTGFAYSNVSSHLLAAVLAEAVDRPLLAYARDRLFDPLGIDTRPAVQPTDEGPAAVRRYERAGFAWPRDRQGVHLGWGLMKLSPLDLLKLGRLHLDGGRWEGRQVVPEEWVREATSPATVIRGIEGEGYGFQWWTTTADGHEAFAAVGGGGQLVEVVPALDLVVVVTTQIDSELPFETETWMLLVDSVVAPAVGEDG